MIRSIRTAILALSLLTLITALWADGILIPQPVPEAPKPRPLPVKWHRVDVQINNQVAQTSIDQVFINEHDRDLEATYLFPLPEQAAISEFAMFTDDKRITGTILDRDEARRTYEEIVRQMRDPALLEYVGRDLFRARVYPVPAKGEKRIQMKYSEVLKLDGGVCKYVYPLDIEKYSPKPLQEVAINVTLQSKVPIKAVYSPTHKIDVHRKDDFNAVIGFEAKDVRPDQDFVLYYTVSQKDFGLNLITHRPAGEDGFFLMLVAPKEGLQAQEIAAKDIIFVFDTSGSMAGEKIRQARDALRFCINRLNRGDRFNIVTFASAVETFDENIVPASPQNVERALKFIDGIEAAGATDIDSALKTALDMVKGDRPSMILFLTDGMPTAGEKDEAKIIQNVAQRNSGMPQVTRDVDVVGETEDGRVLVSVTLNEAELTDAVEMIANAGNVAVIIRGDVRGRKVTMELVNVPVVVALKTIADASGCRFEQKDDTVILTAMPGGGKRPLDRESAPGKAKRKARIFVFGVGHDVNTHLLDRIAGDNGGTSDYVEPGESIEADVSSLYTKIAHPVLSNISVDFGDITVHDYYPRELPDLFKGVQLTLLGRYKGDGAATIKLSGYVGGQEKTFTFDAAFPKEEKGNSFIPRLWATRKIGVLLDEIRLNGESKELKDSIIALSTRYGVMTPYTSFLVQERKDLVAARARRSLAQRSGFAGPALGSASLGVPAGPPAPPAAMPQASAGGKAVEAAKHIGNLVRAEEELDSAVMSQPVAVVDGKTFYFDGETWIDNDFDEALPAHEIRYMSDAYFALLNVRPDWGKFLSLGDKVVFRIGDEVIEISDTGNEKLTEEELRRFEELGK